MSHKTPHDQENCPHLRISASPTEVPYCADCGEKFGGEIHFKLPTNPDMKTGIELIAAERERQITAEGWTPEHDDEHKEGELAQAALCYIESALGIVDEDDVPLSWPWDKSWWKPSDRDLEKAGALIAADLDRRNRQQNVPAMAAPTQND